MGSVSDWLACMSAGSAAALFGDRRTILLVDLTCLGRGPEGEKDLDHASWGPAGADVVVLPSLVSMTHSKYALVLEALRAYHVPPEMSSINFTSSSALIHHSPLLSSPLPPHSLLH